MAKELPSIRCKAVSTWLMPSQPKTAFSENCTATTMPSANKVINSRRLPPRPCRHRQNKASRPTAATYSKIVRELTSPIVPDRNSTADAPSRACRRRCDHNHAAESRPHIR